MISTYKQFFIGHSAIKSVKQFTGALIFSLAPALLLQPANAFAQVISANFGPTEMYGSQADIIANEPLTYSKSWFVGFNNSGNVPVTHPRIEFKSQLPFLSFGPNDPSIFRADPSSGTYIWDWGNNLTILPQYGVAAGANLGVVVKRPRFTLARTVEPSVLTDPTTLQTITLDFALLEPLPEGCNNLYVSAGSPAHADAHNLVEGEFVWQSDVLGWQSNPGLTSAFWVVNPSQLQLGVRYRFQAVLRSVKSDALIGSPVFVPGVSVDYWDVRGGSSENSRSVTVEHLEGSSVTFSVTQPVDWFIALQNWRSIQWLEARLFEVTPPPYQVRVNATVDINPETINIKSKGVVTAFINLPKEYDVTTIGLGPVFCDGVPSERVNFAAGTRTIIAKFPRSNFNLTASGLAKSLELHIRGELADGTVFEGSDTVRVIQ